VGKSLFNGLKTSLAAKRTPKQEKVPSHILVYDGIAPMSPTYF